MAWIEAHQELRNHPKAKHLAALLGIPKAQAIGHLFMLWWWAVDYATDGYVGRYPDAVIADGAEWDGDPACFVQALREARWLDPDGKLHDWEQYAGRLIERREANRQRVAEWRRKRSEQARRASGTDNVTRTQRVTNDARADSEHVPYRATIPDLTGPDQNTPPPIEGDTPLPAQEPDSNREAREFFEYWCSVWRDVHPIGPRWTDQRRKKIKARLRSFSLDELKRACDNLHASPWARGDNERGWVADLDYLIRSDEVVDRWLRKPEAQPPARAAPARAAPARPKIRFLLQDPEPDGEEVGAA